MSFRKRPATDPPLRLTEYVHGLFSFAICSFSPARPILTLRRRLRDFGDRRALTDYTDPVAGEVCMKNRRTLIAVAMLIIIVAGALVVLDIV
jgi:hypothetical protein